MYHTKGHSAGHAIIKLTQNNGSILHIGDIMPIYVQQNSLWVMAYGDYPKDSIYAKHHWLAKAYEIVSKLFFIMM